MRELFIEAKKLCESGLSIDEVISHFKLTKNKAIRLKNLIHVWLLWLEGKRDTHISAELGISRLLARQWRIAIGLPAHGGGRPSGPKVEDYFSAIVDMVEDGFQAKEIADALKLPAKKTEQVIQIWKLTLAGYNDEDIGREINLHKTNVCRIRNKIFQIYKKKKYGMQGINQLDAKQFNYIRSAYQQQDDGTFIYALQGKTDLPKRIKVVDLNERIPRGQFTSSRLEKLMKQHVTLTCE